MRLLGSLFGSASAQAKVTLPASQHATRSPGIIHIRLETAHLVLIGGSVTEVHAQEPFSSESAPDGVLVTEHAEAPKSESPVICRLEIPQGATVDVHLAAGGLTVREFQGTLRARVLIGGVSVKQSEGRFRTVVPVGSVDFDRVSGEIDILTSSGTVTARHTHGGLQAVSSSGSMEFEDVEGSLAARTTIGSIDASDLHGAARLSTRTGAVRVSGACRQLTVRTHSGDVDLDCSIVAHTTLETHKGNLDLKLGPESNVHLEATVGRGVVRTERISPLPGSSRRTLRSTLGLGQSRLRLASASGAINVVGPPTVARVPRAALSA
jgi:DUF4097 and DUF4098 domain-containing protein YvlB